MDLVPKISQPIVGGFLWFSKRYLRKHFHAFAANRVALKQHRFTVDDALVVYANHASWWDPISALCLSHATFPDHRVYSPIDAEALAKYQMFAKMGFFGVDQSSWRGAAEFLRRSSAILEQPAASLWLTPEGRFVDPRDTSAELAPGLSHLAARLSVAAERSKQSCRRVWFLPVAVEYVFWEERKPEALCWFGDPVCATAEDAVAELGRSSERDRAQEVSGLASVGRGDKAAWQALLSHRLRDAQVALAAASIARDSSQFEILIGGRSGTFFIYDWWRQAVSKLTGKPLNTDHSDKLQS